MCDCDLLYQEMECCLQFSDFVHKVRWVRMWFPIYLHWNHTLQSHRMGVEPNRVWHHTHQCIARTWNRTIWTPSLTSTQSIFCITVANKKIAPCERAFSVSVTIPKMMCRIPILSDRWPLTLKLSLTAHCKRNLIKTVQRWKYSLKCGLYVSLGRDYREDRWRCFPNILVKLICAGEK